MPFAIARTLVLTALALAGTSAPLPTGRSVPGYGGGQVVFEESQRGEVHQTVFRMNGQLSVKEVAFLIHPYMSRRCGNRFASLQDYQRETKVMGGKEVVANATIRFQCRELPGLPARKANPHSFVKDMCGEFRASPLLQEACEPFLAE